MGLADRKAVLRKEIERKERYLASMEAMPDFDVLDDGTVLALAVTYGQSKPYPVIGYKAGGTWHLTGAKSPNAVDGDTLSEWLMSQGRHLVSAVVLAEFTIQSVPPFDLGEAMLAAMRDFPRASAGLNHNEYGD